MRATLTKKIKVNSALAYLTIEREQERPDIVDYLRSYREGGRGYENELIEERVKEHLKSLRILDPQGGITRKGELIMESGKLIVCEEGKYRVWYTRQDPFFGDTIFHLSRYSPKKDEQRLKLEEVNFYGRSSTLLPIGEGKSLEVRPIARVKDYKEFSYSEWRAEGELTLEWEWNELDSSTYRVSGRIDNKDVKEHSFEVKEKELPREMKRVFGDDWNSELNRLAIRDIEELSESSIDSFLKSEEITNKLHFDKLYFRDIPLMPSNLEVARRWRDRLLTNGLDKDYYLSSDFEALCKEINSKKGFEAFKGGLELPAIDIFRQKLYSQDRAKQRKSYWHLTAPFDLNPDSDGRNLVGSFSHIPGEQTTFREIVRKLKGRNRVKALFYFDKYSSTEWQQRRLAALFAAFGELELKVLITRTKQSGRSRYLEQNCPALEQIDIEAIFSREKPNHSRYIIYLNESGELVVWGVNHSIDFIRLKDANITPDTAGDTEDVAFEQHRLEMLKSELREYITERIKEVE